MLEVKYYGREVCKIPKYHNRLTNRSKCLGYGTDNPRTREPYLRHDKTVMDSYIYTLKEKLEVCADYYESVIRFYMYNTLCYNSELKNVNKKLFYARYLVLCNEGTLSFYDQKCFDDIKDSYYLHRKINREPTIDELLECRDIFIHVDESASKTIKNYREKLRKYTIDQRVMSDIDCYNITDFYRIDTD